MGSGLDVRFTQVKINIQGDSVQVKNSSFHLRINGVDDYGIKQDSREIRGESESEGKKSKDVKN